MTLDAAGFLLLAEGHLHKARGLVGKPNQTGYQDMAYWIHRAARNTREALNLAQKKEGLCKP